MNTPSIKVKAQIKMGWTQRNYGGANEWYKWKVVFFHFVSFLHPSPKLNFLWKMFRKFTWTWQSFLYPQSCHEWSSMQENILSYDWVIKDNLLLLLLSRFSRVRLRATPQTAAHQALPSLEFSRQEHWSGLPLPSPLCESEKWKWSRPAASDS